MAKCRLAHGAKRPLIVSLKLQQYLQYTISAVQQYLRAFKPAGLKPWATRRLITETSASFFIIIRMTAQIWDALANLGEELAWMILILLRSEYLLLSHSRYTTGRFCNRPLAFYRLRMEICADTLLVDFDEALAERTRLLQTIPVQQVTFQVDCSSFINFQWWGVLDQVPQIATSALVDSWTKDLPADRVVLDYNAAMFTRPSGDGEYYAANSWFMIEERLNRRHKK